MSEPPHIHVIRDDHAAKFWLTPLELVENWGFPAHEITTIRGIIAVRTAEIEKRWREFFNAT